VRGGEGERGMAESLVASLGVVVENRQGDAPDTRNGRPQMGRRPFAASLECVVRPGSLRRVRAGFRFMQIRAANTSRTRVNMITHMREASPAHKTPRAGQSHLLPLPVLAPVAVATPARFLRTEPLLLRRLHVRHVLAVLAKHTASVNLTAEALECAVDRFVSSYFNTNSQNKSPP